MPRVNSVKEARHLVMSPTDIAFLLYFFSFFPSFSLPPLLSRLLIFSSVAASSPGASSSPLARAEASAARSSPAAAMAGGGASAARSSPPLFPPPREPRRPGSSRSRPPAMEQGPRPRRRWMWPTQRWRGGGAEHGKASKCSGGVGSGPRGWDRPGRGRLRRPSPAGAALRGGGDGKLD